MAGDTDPQQPQEPTPAQAAQISQAAGQAVGQTIEGGGSADDARQAAAAAMEQKANEVNVTISAEDRTAIVEALVDALEERGAFEPPPAPEVPLTAPTPAAPAPVLEPAADNDHQPPAGPPETPHKRSLAERFMGA